MNINGYSPMCPRFYMSMSLCVPISKCPRFYVANIMPNRPFVAMVLCVQSSLWPWFYVAPDVQIDPLCRRSYVSRIQCDQCPMCPRLYVSMALCGRSLHAIGFYLKLARCNRGKLNSAILNQLSQPNHNHNLNPTQLKSWVSHRNYQQLKLHEGARKEQYLENKSFQSACINPKEVFGPHLNPKNDPIGPQKAQNDPKNKKSQKKILQIKIHQSMWINLKNIFLIFYKFSIVSYA